MHNKWKDKEGKIHNGNCLGSKNEYDVIECSLCGFKHVVPIPTEEFLSNYYEKHFVKNRPKGFYKKLEDDLPWSNIFYNEKYDLFERNIISKNPSLLDVGSGLGFFLQCGKDRGWNTQGIEPSKESFDYSKNNGLKVKNEYLDEKNYHTFGKFDVIHFHEVLEHLPNPMKYIEIAKKILKPNGLICIVSPNDFNPLQEVFIKNNEYEKWWIAPPEHINYFDFSSVKKLLINNGFKIVEQTSTFPLELFLLMGDNYIGNDKIGKIIHSKRVSFEKIMSENGYENIRRDIYNKFSELSIGREFCIIGKLN